MRIADLVRDVDGEPVPTWTRYQLRHSRLSEVRRDLGIEGTAAVGGHSLGKEARITEGYSGATALEVLPHKYLPLNESQGLCTRTLETVRQPSKTTSQVTRSSAGRIANRRGQ